MGATTATPTLLGEDPGEDAKADGALAADLIARPLDPSVALAQALVAVAGNGGGGKPWLVALAVLVAAVGLGAGWLARGPSEIDALAARMEKLERAQGRLHRAQTLAFYAFTDATRWNVDATTWLAEQLVPGSTPPSPPDTRAATREVLHLLAVTED